MITRFFRKIKNFSFFDRSYFILLIPKDDQSSLKINLPKTVLNAVTISLIGIGIIFFTLVGLNYYKLTCKIKQITSLRKKNIKLQQENETIVPKLQFYEKNNRLIRKSIELERKQHTENLTILANRLEELEKYYIDFRILVGKKIGIKTAKLLNYSWKHPEWFNKIHKRSDYSVNNLPLFEIYIDNKISTNIRKINTLNQKLAYKKNVLNDVPSTLPVDNSYIRSDYGYRVGFNGEREFHKGIDFPAGYQSPIYAPADGVVVLIGKDIGYGFYMIVNHGGRYSTRYAHLSEFAVGLGDKVERGDIIAYVGNTGRSTGNHLHYEVRKFGNHIDPKEFLPETFLKVAY